jgi:hypothetical protein
MSNLHQGERLRKAEIDAVVAADRRRIDWAEIQRRHGYSAEVMTSLQGVAERLTRQNLATIPLAEPLPARIRAHARLPRAQAVRIRVRAPRLAGARRARARRAVRTSTRAGPSDPAPPPSADPWSAIGDDYELLADLESTHADSAEVVGLGASIRARVESSWRARGGS